jgi:hypothetical protein
MPCDIRLLQEWIRDLRVERRSERHVLRIELVVVDRRVVRSAEAQVIAARSEVLHVDRHAARQLALDVDRVLHDARRRAVLIDEADVGADAAQQALGVA